MQAEALGEDRQLAERIVEEATAADDSRVCSGSTIAVCNDVLGISELLRGTQACR